MKLHSFDLDSRANEYVKDVLAYENLLSKTLKQSLEISNGKVTTYLPPRTPITKSYMFKNGGILAKTNFKEETCKIKNLYLKSIPTLNEFLVDYIFNLINKSNNSLCIFDDIMIDPGDNELNRFSDTYIEVENEIYHIVSRSNTNKKVLKRIIQAVHLNWHFLCVIVSAGDYHKHISKNKMKKDEFVKFFSNVSDLIIGAYDGEGFLFWKGTPEK